MITATTTRLMPVHPHPPFAIGAIPIRATTLWYPNAPFRGDQLFSNGQLQIPRPLSGDVKRSSSHRTRPDWAPAIDDKVLSFQKSRIAVDSHRAIDPRRYLRFPVRVGTQRLSMEQARLAVMVAAALSVAAFNADAQDGDVAAGRTFAREARNSCHVVEPTNPSPRMVVIGPDFQDIANTKGMTATALRVFLTTSHPKMPNLILAPQQIADVSAYILSLRERR